MTSPYRARQRLAVAGLMVVLGIAGGVAVALGGPWFQTARALQEDLFAWIRERVEVPYEPPAPLVEIALAQVEPMAAPEPARPPPPPPKMAPPPKPPLPKMARVESPVVAPEPEPPVAAAEPEPPVAVPEPEPPTFARVERLFASAPGDDKPVPPRSAVAEAPETPHPIATPAPPPAVEPVPAAPPGKPLVLSPATMLQRPPVSSPTDPATPRAAAVSVLPRRIASIFGSRQATATGLPHGLQQGATANRPLDVSGWNGIQWGSSNGVLEKAFGRQIASFESDAAEYSEGFDVAYAAPNVGFGTMSFNILFQMAEDTKGLRQVLIDGVGVPKHGDFEAIFNRMVEIYGRPASFVDFAPRNINVDRPLNIYKKAVWKFPTTTIHFTVMTGPIYFRDRKGWIYLRYFPTR